MLSFSVLVTWTACLSRLWRSHFFKQCLFIAFRVITTRTFHNFILDWTKWKWKSLSHIQLCHPLDWVHGILQAWILEWEAFPSSGGLPNPEIEPRFPALQADSLPAESQGSPRVLEWVAYPFSRRSFRPRNWTGVLSSALQVDSLSIELSWKLREIELKPGHKYFQVLNMSRYDFLIFKVSQEEIICLVKSTDSCWYMAKPIQYCKVKKKEYISKRKIWFCEIILSGFQSKDNPDREIIWALSAAPSPPPHHKQDHTCTHTHTHTDTHTHSLTSVTSVTKRWRMRSRHIVTQVRAK